MPRQPPAGVGRLASRRASARGASRLPSRGYAPDVRRPTPPLPADARLGHPRVRRVIAHFSSFGRPVALPRKRARCQRHDDAPPHNFFRAHLPCSAVPRASRPTHDRAPANFGAGSRSAERSVDRAVGIPSARRRGGRVAQGPAPVPSARWDMARDHHARGPGAAPPRRFAPRVPQTPRAHAAGSALRLTVRACAHVPAPRTEGSGSSALPDRFGLTALMPASGVFEAPTGRTCSARPVSRRRAPRPPNRGGRPR